MKRSFAASLCSASALALMSVPAATAQEAPAEEGGITEIVVTAQRTETSVQKSPVAISVVDGDALTESGIVNAVDLAKKVPGLEIAATGRTQIFLRGVGSNAASSYGDPAVAYNLDQAYIARISAIGGNFYDLERVEVVKGPQGTLYGRNATGGAINVVTKKPDLGGVAADVALDIGSYDLIKVNGTLNLPLTEDLGTRFSFQRVKRDGYLSDGYDDDDGLSLRGHLLYQPSTNFKMLLSADYYQLKGKGPSWSPAALADDYVGPSDPRAQALFRAAAIARYGSALGAMFPLPQGDGHVDNDTIDIRGLVEWDMGGATLTIIPDYRRSTGNTRFYPNGALGDTRDRATQHSLEVRLSNQSSALDWVVGGYYFHEDQDTFYSYYQGVLDQEVYAHLKTRNLAVFGQATYHLNDALRLTGGLRYTSEDKTQDGTVYCAQMFCPAPGVRAAFTGDRTFENVSVKAGFEVDLAPRSMLYGSFSTGYKAGGFSPVLGANTFEPEKLSAFAIGSKNRFLDNKLQVNLEAFFWRYTDMQVAFLSTGLVAPGVTGSVFVTENIGKSEIKGADLDIVYQPTRNDTFNLAVSYLDGVATEFVYRPASAPTSTCGITGVAPSIVVDCSGKPLPRSPKWSLSGSYGRVFDLGGAGQISLNVGTKFASSSWGSTNYLPDHRQKSYTRSDASISYTTEDGRYALTAYVNNIEDSAVQTSAGSYPLFPLNYKVLMPPRTYGLRFSAKFGN